MAIKTNIVVLDSWWGPLHPAYTQAFPNVTFGSWQNEELRLEPAHPHGGWVASLIAQQLGPFTATHIDFVRMFDRNGSFVLSDSAWKETVYHIAALKPQYICCSWGMADGDSPLGELTQRKMFDDDWVYLWQESVGNADVFWAAGNDDNNDEDDDIDAPQKFLVTGRDHIIGSDRFDGVPSKFSGDGRVDCMYPGENTYSLDPLSGDWVKWSGTSAAAPSALGDILSNNIGRAEAIKAYWKATASKATRFRFQTSPHPKAGVGSMNPQFELNIRATGRWPTLGQRFMLGFRPSIRTW